MCVHVYIHLFVVGVFYVCVCVCAHTCQEPRVLRACLIDLFLTLRQNAHCSCFAFFLFLILLFSIYPSVVLHQLFLLRSDSQPLHLHQWQLSPR